MLRRVYAWYKEGILKVIKEGGRSLKEEGVTFKIQRLALKATNQHSYPTRLCFYQFSPLCCLGSNYTKKVLVAYLKFNLIRHPIF